MKLATLYLYRDKLMIDFSLTMEQVRVGGRLVKSWISSRLWSRLGLVGDLLIVDFSLDMEQARVGRGQAYHAVQLDHQTSEDRRGTCSIMDISLVV